MKKLWAFLLVLVLLLSACTAEPLRQAGQGTEQAVKDLIDMKVQSVRTGDLDKLISNIDPEDKELQTEQTNWLTDIKQNPIKDYKLQLLELEKIDNKVYRAKLRQEYNGQDGKHRLDYYNKYKLVGNKLYDAGNYFEELKEGNIIIRYTAANETVAKDIIGDMNKLYQSNIQRWQVTPSRPLVIKIYDDIEELRQSIKLSMWQCAGWYEYGESVKMYINESTGSRERISNVVNHEMIHLFTAEKSSGNLAYWFAEGLATYFESVEGSKNPPELKRSMNVRLMSIDELETTELEKLEDRQKISYYYNNAHLITAFIIHQYGEDKINLILSELGKFPSLKGATSENDKAYREYLSQALPKVLKLKDYQEFKQLWQKEMDTL